MSMPAHNTAKTSLRSNLEKCKLNGTNFLDWSRILRIVLKAERTEYVLTKKLPKAPKKDATDDKLDAYERHKEDSLDVQCLMLANMETSLQTQFENVDAFKMYQQLKALFQKEARNERYDTVCALIDCKLGNGQESSPHVLKMMALSDRLVALGVPIPKELSVDLILRSLPERFNQFVVNFNMHQFDKSLSELHGMITTADRNLKKPKSHTSEVLVVQNKQQFKKKKGKKSKAKAPAVAKGKKTLKAGKGVQKTDKCHYCDMEGHWKRNCAKYAADKKNGTLTPGIFVIEAQFASHPT